MEDKLKKIRKFIDFFDKSPDVIGSKTYEEETVFNFGKHRGKTFKWVIENDRSYIVNYCMTQKFEHDNPGYTFEIDPDTKKKYNL